ncbi:MAG: UDP-N-acetylmuramoyl-tripeptide--D-alanyl-D-alanine ligase [Mariprofundales bacterium]
MSGAMMAEVTGGQWCGSVPHQVTGFAIDNRRLCDGDAFVALRGPNHDGHHFAASVDGRAAALVGERACANAWQGLHAPQLLVGDSHQALIDLAAAHRRNCGVGRVIAVVGSQGKTTLRRMIAHLLAGDGRQVAQTEGNLNNLIGTPLSLLAIDAGCDDAVIECGISEIGEMAQLAAMVQPEVVVVPGLSLAHSAGLRDLATIVREKGVMVAQAKTGCFAGAGVADLLVRYGVEVGGSLLAAEDGTAVQWRLDGCALSLWQGEQRAALVLDCPAPHLAADMALAATVVRDLQPTWSLASIVDRLKSWQPMAGRMVLQRGVAGCQIIDDSYNANPASMRAALDTLRAMPTRRIAILGDMGELGDSGLAAHQQLSLDGIACVVLIGAQMATLAKHHDEYQCFASLDAAAIALSELAGSLTDQDTVLVKGSRMMGLDAVVSQLTEGVDAL